MIGNDLTRWHPCAQFWFTQFKGLGLGWARMDNTIVQIYLLSDSEIGTTLVGVLEDITETGRVSQIGWFGCSSSMSWQLMLFLPGGPRKKHVDSPASQPTGPSSSWALSARGLDNAVWKGVNDNALTVWSIEYVTPEETKSCYPVISCLLPPSSWTMGPDLVSDTDNDIFSLRINFRMLKEGENEDTVSWCKLLWRACFCPEHTPISFGITNGSIMLYIVQYPGGRC